MSILTVENLSKNYGNIQALKNVSFSVPEGTVFGILGPNGSGKTTMLGTITDILKPTSGSYKLFDEAAVSSASQEDWNVAGNAKFLSLFIRSKKPGNCR